MNKAKMALFIRNRKALMDRIAAILTKLGQRRYAVHEDQAQYRFGNNPDTDSDTDADGNQENSPRSTGGHLRP
jgi:hypothetical protein